MYSQQSPQLSFSISDCSRIFGLTRFTPEQIVDAVFLNSKALSLPADRFTQLFRVAFEKNVSAEDLNKIDGAIQRVIEVCSKSPSQITVDQLGRGTGVFTSRREANSALKDFYFFLDKNSATVVQESELESFLRDASNLGANKLNPQEYADFKQQIVQSRGKVELTYWNTYILRNHPAVKSLLDTYREFRAKRVYNPSRGASIAGSLNGIPNFSSSEDVRRGAPQEVVHSSRVLPQTQTQPQPQTQQYPQGPIQIFGGERGILARNVRRLGSFDEFLALGERLGLTRVSPVAFIEHTKAYFHLHKRELGDIYLHEFIRLCVEMFMKPEDNYYDFSYAITQIFQFMDLNDNGILEVNETLKGIIHLFGGTEKEKITAAFLLFDSDESGFVEFDEVFNFVLTTLKLTQHQGKGLQEESENELRDIAYATATDIYKLMDLDHTGKVSIEEFLVWFQTSQGEINPKDIETAKLLKENKIREIQERSEQNQNATFEAQKKKDEELKKLLEESRADVHIIEDIRGKIPFEKVPITAAVEILKNETHSNVVNFSGFHNFIKALVEKYELGGNEHVLSISRKLFNSLDANKNGLLEIAEIATGLGLLCGGSQTEKLEAGFSLYDGDNDNHLNFAEARAFMHAFFRIIKTDNPNTSISNQDPQRLAHALAFTLFTESGVPLEGGIEFYHLRKWVESIQKV